MNQTKRLINILNDITFQNNLSESIFDILFKKKLFTTINEQIIINNDCPITIIADFYCAKIVDNTCILATYNENDKIIRIFECSYDEINIKIMKEYDVYKLSFMIMKYDYEGNIILYVSDNKNIKLFRFDSISKTWEKTYFILKHNNFRIIKINIENKFIDVYNETNYHKKFVINHKMNRLDEIRGSPIMILAAVNFNLFHSICDVIAIQLENMGWDVFIIDDYEIITYIERFKSIQNHFFLLFDVFRLEPDIFEKMENYIICQFEQHNGGKISTHYANLMKSNMFYDIFKNAKLTIDYAMINVKTMKKWLNLKFEYIPTPITYIPQANQQTKINDIVFIGSMNNKRKYILNALEKKNYRITIPETFVFGDELQNFLQQSKILLNIHYYDDAILERPRLNDALLSGIRIISEYPWKNDMDVCNDYKNVVDFIDIIDSDTSELEKCIDRILDELNDQDFCEKREILLKDTIYKLENEFIDRITDVFDVKKFMNY